MFCLIWQTAMTPDRRAAILADIDAADAQRMLSGLRWGWMQQGEWTDEVAQHFQDVALERGWWPVPWYPGPGG